MTDPSVSQLQTENKELREGLEGSVTLLINSGLMSKTESATNIDAARLWIAVPHMLEGLKIALTQLILVDPTPEGDEIREQLRATISQAESSPTIGTTLASQKGEAKK